MSSSDSKCRHSEHGARQVPTKLAPSIVEVLKGKRESLSSMNIA